MARVTRSPRQELKEGVAVAARGRGYDGGAILVAVVGLREQP